MLTIRLGHSPDPDDAFMWYPLADFVGPDGRTYTPQIDTAGYRFEHVLEDIQSLNERSEKGELEITAISIHQYPHVAEQYALTTCGASMGEGYGPMIVSREPIELRELINPVTEPTPEHKPRVAIPGWRTSAWLALQLRMAELGVKPGQHNRAVQYDFVPFDRILDVVRSGEYTAGLIIHEGQITYAEHGLHLVEDLGRWWTDTRGLPLPLGGNAIRRDLVEAGEAEKICRVLLESIRYALAHREEAVTFARQWGRGLDDALADRFVGMYVNDRTLDYGEDGRAAVRLFLEQAREAGIVPDRGEVEFIAPA